MKGVSEVLCRPNERVSAAEILKPRLEDRRLIAVHPTEGTEAMLQMDGNQVIGGAIMLTLPLYIILQIWCGIAWSGRWRLAALVPLIVFLPTLAVSVFELTRGSNLWPITTIG